MCRFRPGCPTGRVRTARPPMLHTTNAPARKRCGRLQARQATGRSVDLLCTVSRTYVPPSSMFVLLQDKSNVPEHSTGASGSVSTATTSVVTGSVESANVIVRSSGEIADWCKMSVTCSSSVQYIALVLSLDVVFGGVLSIINDFYLSMFDKNKKKMTNNSCNPSTIEYERYVPNWIKMFVSAIIDFLGYHLDNN